MMKWTKHIKDESGASAIIVALMLVVLLGAAALAMDLGSAYSTGAKVQNTCDAAALAAAKELPNRCSTESVQNNL
jgi:Flp pilus assembly protein TadG